MRRRSTHIWYLLLGVFAMMFAFGFLINHHSSDDKVEAASLDGFDPGFIISDWQMSNYNSMSEAEIQAFLTSKNSCNNRDYDYYLRLSANKNYTWHWANGHFVCLSEELFGDGEVIGSGETAAHILWQTAQDYKINPQALLVLLQKETGLITDPIPNNGDYRKATGYGCPDTAPCSSQYYGFKNQVRRAAALYRTVLDGGWTNYPLGENYVQYNPNPDCGGSVVNIRSLATSALYRYTPYQPNAGALAAGYGTAYCGAYGNRNFYLYFQDWFGGVNDEGIQLWDMEEPRYMSVKNESYYYSLVNNNYSQYPVFEGDVVYFSKKTYVDGKGMCLKSQYDVEHNNNNCVFFEDLKEMEWDWRKLDTPRYMVADNDNVINPSSMRSVNTTSETLYFEEKVFLPDGAMCLRFDENSCLMYSDLEEAKINKEKMLEPRYMTTNEEKVEIYNPITKQVIEEISTGEEAYFEEKMVDFEGNLCLVINDEDCVKYDDLTETWMEMERPREMRMNMVSYKINAIDLSIDGSILLPFNMVRKFTRKRFLRDNSWCLQTEYDELLNTNNCIRYRELSEL